MAIGSFCRPIFLAILALTKLACFLLNNKLRSSYTLRRCKRNQNRYVTLHILRCHRSKGFGGELAAEDLQRLKSEVVPE
jgi:hypothetical protein